MPRHLRSRPTAQASSGRLLGRLARKKKARGGFGMGRSGTASGEAGQSGRTSSRANVRNQGEAGARAPRKVMATKRVTVTLDSDSEEWLIGRSLDRHSISERIRICLREYMSEHPRKFRNRGAGNFPITEPFLVSRGISLERGGLSPEFSEILDAHEESFDPPKGR